MRPIPRRSASGRGACASGDRTSDRGSCTGEAGVRRSNGDLERQDVLPFVAGSLALAGNPRVPEGNEFGAADCGHDPRRPGRAHHCRGVGVIARVGVQSPVPFWCPECRGCSSRARDDDEEQAMPVSPPGRSSYSCSLSRIGLTPDLELVEFQGPALWPVWIASCQDARLGALASIRQVGVSGRVTCVPKDAGDATIRAEDPMLLIAPVMAGEVTASPCISERRGRRQVLDRRSRPEHGSPRRHRQHRRQAHHLVHACLAPIRSPRARPGGVVRCPSGRVGLPGFSKHGVRWNRTPAPAPGGGCRVSTADPISRRC